MTWAARPDLCLGEELFRKFLYPYLKRLADLGREYGLPTMMHCCGSYAQLMPALIESGRLRRPEPAADHQGNAAG